MKSLSSLLSFGWVKIFLAIVILFGIGWYISDSLGVPFGWLGTLFWIAITLFTAIFGIIYFAQFLTPIAGDMGWRQGMTLILRALSTPAPRNTHTVKENKSKKGGGRRRRKKMASTTPVPRSPDQPPPSFRAIRAGILRTYQVFALVRGRKYIGSRGPGFVILNDEKAYVRHIIDLRQQKRVQPKVRVTTKDGIQIVTNVSVVFRIMPDPQPRHEATLYPYDKNAIFQVSYADTIDDHGGQMSWQDKIIPQAITFASQEVSKYSLNDLSKLEGGVSNIDEIKRVMLLKMSKKFESHGIKIIKADISAPPLPPEIRQQYLNAWQSKWKEKIKEKLYEGEVKSLRRRKQARALAQIEMIDAISQNLSTMHREDDADMVEIITLRMIEALEDAVAEGSVRSLVPQQIMAHLIEDTAKQMRLDSKESRSRADFSAPQPPRVNFHNHDEEDSDDIEPDVDDVEAEE